MKRILRIAFCLFVAQLATGVCDAQWTKAGSMYGGYILHLAASGNEVFAGTNGNDLFLSTNDGNVRNLV